jgi:excinuclease ABC subunit C
MPFDIKKLNTYPTECGVYLMKDEKDHVLYIGKAKNLKSRLKQYFSMTDSRVMIPFLIAKIEKIDIIVAPSEKEALLLENTLIKKHQPKYNALLKDDKTFVSLMINQDHPWPMLKLIRYKGAPKKEGLYFGPYTSSLAAKEIFDLLCKVFPLRQCSDRELLSRTRPCILYSMKRCLAPCVGKCTKEEYSLFVNQTIAFLKGHDEQIVSELTKQMEIASEQLEFEKAAAILHSLKQIEYVTKNTKSLVHSHIADCDAIGLYSEGHKTLLSLLTFRTGRLVSSDHFTFSQIAENPAELIESFILQHYLKTQDLPKEILSSEPLLNIPTLVEVLQEQLHQSLSILCPKKGEKKELTLLAKKNAKTLFYQEIDQEDLKETLLQEMQEKLFLTRFPVKIECFDTSNLSGKQAVASLIAFNNGKKDPSRYRTYHIKGKKTDDYSALKEVLFRRFSKGKESGDLPDLIIMDGGKGQLTLAHAILEELEIASCDLIALAKEESKHTKSLTQEQIFILSHKDPIVFPRHSPVLFLLQNIRDEAHRKALSFHRKSREKTLFSSELDSLKGIGPIKKKKLLEHFGSVKQLKKADASSLKKIQGLSEKDLKTLLKFIEDSNLH